MRLNSLTGIVGFGAGAIAILSTGIEPGIVGFSLVNALSFSSVIMYTVRSEEILQLEVLVRATLTLRYTDMSISLRLK